MKETQIIKAFNNIREATPKEDESEMEPANDDRDEPLIKTDQSDKYRPKSPSNVEA